MALSLCQKLQTFPLPCSHLSLCLPWISLPFFIHFFFITLASPLPRLLSVFLLHFLMLWSMARWVLFIYGHALSVCVGLSNIHLSCAAIIQSLIPSHMRGMKHEQWSLLRSLSLNTPDSKLCRAQRALLRTTKRTNWLYPFAFTSFFSNFFIAFSFCLCLLLFFSLVQCCRAGQCCRS